MLYVEHLFLCSNAVDGMHIFKSRLMMQERPKVYGLTFGQKTVRGIFTMSRCRFPIDIRVYRKTRVLPFGKTSLLLETTAIHGGIEKPFANRRCRLQGARQKSTAGTLKNIHPCIFFNCEFSLTSKLVADLRHGHPCPF